MHVPVASGYGFKTLPMAAARPVKTIDNEVRVTAHAALPRQQICRQPMADIVTSCT